MLKNSFVLLILVILSGCVIKKPEVVNPEEPKDPNPSAEFCYGWKNWHDSNGEYGIPDRMNNYEQWCKND